MDGKMDEAKGRIKEAAGDLTDNDDLKTEGKIDKGKGKAKGFVDDVGDALKGKD
ncbi:MAG TPA: CsbD family protein [Acidimicrobiales bacterium]|nr:CsbD family protein [Acidimicrobiales bacterium]